MTAPSEGSLRWHPAGTKAELPVDGGGRMVEAGGRRLAVFIDGDELRAIDDACPHMGASLGMGVALEGDVTCPWHGWHFRLRDGVNTDGLECRVSAYAVRVTAGGAVEIALPPEPAPIEAPEEAPKSL